MQTFLPYESFSESARALDYRRLGKQRVEARQILDVLSGRTSAWRNHPAVRMWRGFEPALRCYHDVIVREWVSRGYRNSMPYLASDADYDAPRPPWLGDESFHSAHRSTLLFKDPSHYGLLGWGERPSYGYVWPVV